MGADMMCVLFTPSSHQPKYGLLCPAALLMLQQLHTKRNQKEVVRAKSRMIIPL
jgi:hypothetical protein